MGNFDLLCYLVVYVPSSTRNIPLMLRQFFLLAGRLYSYLLRSAEEMRESNMQYYEALLRASERSGSIPWNNLMAASYVN